MNRKLGIVGAVIVGSILVSCAQDAIRSAMDPDAGTDGQVVRADGAAAAECCGPPEVPQPVVIFDGGLTPGACTSPVLEVSAYRRVIVHSNCEGASGYAYLLYGHGSAGLLRLDMASLDQMCASPSFRQVVSVDPQLGRQLQYRQPGCTAESKVTVVGYR